MHIAVFRVFCLYFLLVDFLLLGLLGHFSHHVAEDASVDVVGELEVCVEPAKMGLALKEQRKVSDKPGDGPEVS